MGIKCIRRREEKNEWFDNLSMLRFFYSSRLSNYNKIKRNHRISLPCLNQIDIK
jgi:hypothetical protein